MALHVWRKYEDCCFFRLASGGGENAELKQLANCHHENRHEVRFPNQSNYKSYRSYDS